MALSGAFVLGGLWRKGREVRAKDSTTFAPAGRVVLFLGAIVAATLLFDKLGYPLMAFLLLLVLLRILGMKRWAWNALLSILVAGVSYALFVQWLKIPLPRGWMGL
jgi:hypothetical protein